MMSYADGLKLLAEVENPRPADMPEGDYQLWLADLIESKYTYVVASQVREEIARAMFCRVTCRRPFWLAVYITLRKPALPKTVFGSKSPINFCVQAGVWEE